MYNGTLGAYAVPVLMVAFIPIGDFNEMGNDSYSAGYFFIQV